MSARPPAHLTSDIAIRVKAERHSVFVYSKDLDTSASNLALELSEGDYWRIWVKKDIEGAQKYAAKYVWLVGHGEKTASAIVDIDSHPIIEMEDVIDWSEANGATHIIDTCCAPRKRLDAVKASKTKLTYYCKADLDATTASLSIEQLEKWWAQEKFTKAHP